MRVCLCFRFSDWYFYLCIRSCCTGQDHWLKQQSLLRLIHCVSPIQVHLLFLRMHSMHCCSNSQVQVPRRSAPYSSSAIASIFYNDCTMSSDPLSAGSTVPLLNRYC